MIADERRDHDERDEPLSVAILVITFRRPHGLERLIRSLAKLEFPRHPARIELLVVDNDAHGSARPVCDHYRTRVPFEISYAIEPRRGIPIARNRTLEMMDGRCRFCVFVDDDEFVEPGWLDELLHVQARYDADVVAGPVLPEFLSPPPSWIVKGRFFELRRFDTGKALTHAYTNNTLVRAEVIRKTRRRFDERFALTGGEDTHFFRMAHKDGHTFVWADNAIVYDCVPRSRMNLPWLLQRAYRYGTTTPLIACDVRPAPARALLLLPAVVGWVAAGIVFLPISWLFGRHHFARALRIGAFGVGTLSGWYGVRYNEYRRTHGS